MDDDYTQCDECAGKGWNWVDRQVAERLSDTQTFKEECEHCEGSGQIYSED